jgi:hypothetical protein
VRDEISFPQHLGEYRAANVRPVQREFDAAVGRGDLTAELSRKYMSALDDYAEVVRETPGGPDWAGTMPTAHDAATRSGIEEELTWIQSERSRILGHNNGFLNMS